MGRFGEKITKSQYLEYREAVGPSQHLRIVHDGHIQLRNVCYKFSIRDRSRLLHALKNRVVEVNLTKIISTTASISIGEH